MLIARSRARATRTAGLDGGGLGQKCPVVLDGADCRVAPGPAFDHALAAGGTDAITQCFVVEGHGDLGGQGLAVARGNAQRSVVIGTNDLGESSASGGHQRHTAAHGLDRRQGEPLIERRDNSELCFGIQLDDALLGNAGDERDGVAQTQFVDDAGRGAALFEAPDDDQFDMTFGAELGHGLEQIAQALHGDVSAGGGDETAGHSLHMGLRLEEFLIDADRHHM